jgi:hypothetical protein
VIRYSGSELSACSIGPQDLPTLGSMRCSGLKQQKVGCGATPNRIFNDRNPEASHTLRGSAAEIIQLC